MDRSDRHAIEMIRDRSRLRRILRRLAVVILPAFIVTRLISCPSCPLNGCCPVVTLAAGGLFGWLASLAASLRARVSRVNWGGAVRLAAFYVLVFSSVTFALAGALQGADTLSVSPNPVVAQVGETTTVSAIVEFLHPQPCPYPDWKLECSVEGDVTILSVSGPQVSADGMSAEWQISVRVDGNGTLLITYHYGEGCPFGKIENETVQVVGVQPGGQAESRGPGLRQGVGSALSGFLGLRVSILYAMAAVTTAILAYLVYRGVPVDEKGISTLRGSNRIWAVRMTVLAAVAVAFVAIPVALKGYICPFCPLIVPQYPLYFLRTSAPAFSLLNPYYAVPIVVIGVSLIFSRAWCGWICPLGAVQDLVFVGRKSGVELPEKVDSALRKVKYAALVLLAAAVLFTASPWLCENCPLRTLTVTVSKLALHGETLTAVLFSIGVATLAASVIIPRFFCRYCCPTGALLAILSRLGIKAAGIRVNPDRCRNCAKCLALANCPVGLQKPGGEECITCAQCVEACPFGAVDVYPGAG